MKMSRVVLAAALLVSTPSITLMAIAQDRARAQAAPSSPSASQAKTADQTPPPPPPPPPPPAGTRNVQVDVTVKLQGAASPVTKQMSLVAADQTVALGRSGIDVAVPTTVVPGGADSKPVQSYNYRTVGMNVDVRPRIGEGNKITLMLKLNFSSVLKDDAMSGRPSFGNASTDLNLVLDSGKPVLLTQTNDAEIGRGYSVEVKATILR